MKIDKSSTPLPLATTGEGKTRATLAKPADNLPAANSTSVNLGATAEQLRGMKSGMTNTPPINAAKVAEIKQAISEGRFQVNSSVVADGLIKSVTDLINSHKA